MKLYLSQDWRDKFLNDEQEACEYRGFYNEGESWVFLPLPGTKNATLRMVRDGARADLPDEIAAATAVVSRDGGISCFSVRNGRIIEIEGELVNLQEDVYSRNSGILETRALRDKAVFIAGCGSVGSTMAAELARAGVGRLVLADPDRLDPSNIARHQAGLHNLGRLKTGAVKDMVLSINPSISVDAIPEDICLDMAAMEKTATAAGECDLLVCTTDTDNSRIFINDLSLRLGIPSIQAGLHERASSGIVQAVIPGKGACFLCHRDKILAEPRKERGFLAYSEKEEELLRAQPGLSSQVNIVAEAAVLKTLELLSAPPPGENPPSETACELTFLVTRQKAPDGTEGPLAFSTAKLTLEPAENCAACAQTLSFPGESGGCPAG